MNSWEQMGARDLIIPSITLAERTAYNRLVTWFCELKLGELKFVPVGHIKSQEGVLPDFYLFDIGY